MSEAFTLFLGRRFVNHEKFLLKFFSVRRQSRFPRVSETPAFDELIYDELRNSFSVQVF